MSDVDKFEYACYQRFLSMIHHIAGYIECGEGETVKIYQDDATKSWHVTIGSRHYWDDSLQSAFEKALDAANEYHKKTYDLRSLIPPRRPE